MDISGWINGFWSQLADWANAILIVAFAGLPDSPFVMISKNSQITELLSYLNWVIPIDFMISTLELWLVAVGIFYVWQILLRWVKAIE